MSEKYIGSDGREQKWSEKYQQMVPIEIIKEYVDEHYEKQDSQMTIEDLKEKMSEWDEERIEKFVKAIDGFKEVPITTFRTGGSRVETIEIRREA